MQTSATLRYLRTSPRKVRLVAGFIKGMKIEEARKQLIFSPKRSAHPLLKLLNSAAADAKNNYDMEESNLYISRVFVDEGPTLKRWRPRAYGRAFPIMKRTSHITISLDEIKPLLKSGGKMLAKAQKQSVPSEDSAKKIIHREQVASKPKEESKEAQKDIRPIKDKISDQKQEKTPRANLPEARRPEKRSRFNKKRFTNIGRRIFRRKSI